jgi:hypothetical protein
LPASSPERNLIFLLTFTVILVTLVIAVSRVLRADAWGEARSRAD